MTQSSLLQQLREADNPDTIQALALELLAVSKRREMIDVALRKLKDCPLQDTARPVLHDKALYYFEQHQQDAGGLLREQIIRLLMQIGHPNDRELYLRGLNTYEVQPMMGEVTQNLRAVCLIALAIHEPELAHLHAVRLLGETDSTSRYNGEPAITAINLLSQQGQPLPIYAYLLLHGSVALEGGQHELIGKALESLGAAFPSELYKLLLEQFAPRDRAVVNMGIITHIVENRVTSLYPALDDIITRTRHDELHNYGVVMLAVSRDETLRQQLYTLARRSPSHRINNFIEALELIAEPDKNELLDSLRQRLA